MSKILVMVNPWGMNRKDDILNALDNLGTRIDTAYIPKVSLESISEHYGDHNKEEYFKPLVNDYIGKSIVIAVYDGEADLFARRKDELRSEFGHDIEPHPGHLRTSFHCSVAEDEEKDPDLTFWKEYNAWKDVLNYVDN